MDKHCNRIFYIKNNKNQGVSSAFNQGLKLASRHNSCYFLISNNDIVFRYDSIDNLLKFQRKTNLGMVTSIDVKRCFQQDYLTFQIREEDWAGLCWSCFMLRDWAIEKVGYFDENFWPGFCEDLDYDFRLSSAGIEKKSTFTSVIRHDEGATGRGNAWKLGPTCNTHTELFNHAYIKNKNYYGAKHRIGNQYNTPTPQ